MNQDKQRRTYGSLYQTNRYSRLGQYSNQIFRDSVINKTLKEITMDVKKLYVVFNVNTDAEIIRTYSWEIAEKYLHLSPDHAYQEEYPWD